jgi:hypothetical protein
MPGLSRFAALILLAFSAKFVKPSAGSMAATANRFWSATAHAPSRSRRRGRNIAHATSFGQTPSSSLAQAMSQQWGSPAAAQASQTSRRMARPVNGHPGASDVRLSAGACASDATKDAAESTVRRRFGRNRVGLCRDPRRSLTAQAARGGGGGLAEVAKSHPPAHPRSRTRAQAEGGHSPKQLRPARQPGGSSVRRAGTRRDRN